MSADTVPTISIWQSSAMQSETLIRILTHVVNDAWPYLPVCVLNLSHVCRLWRDATLSPAGEPLWRDIDFGNSKLALSSLSQVDQQQLLSVRLRRSSNPNNNPDDYESLKKHISRIERLMIRPDKYEDIAGIIKFFVKHKPLEGVFKTLYISEERNWSCSGDKRESRPLSKRIQKEVLGDFGSVRSLSSIENLVLDAVEIPFKSTLYDNLVHLDLFDFKPRACPGDVIRVLRRSPHLQVLSLDSVLADSDSAVVPSAELLHLRTLTLTSSHISSTAFLVDHIYAPNLEKLDIDVKSTGKGSEFEHLLKPLISWNAVENVLFLQIDSNPNTDAHVLSGRTKGQQSSGINIAIHGCSWSKQLPLIAYFPNVCKIELLANCPLGHLLRGATLDNITHLRIQENINFRLLKHLHPNGRFSKVHTLDLNCASFLEQPIAGSDMDPVSVTECIGNLEHSNSLQLLRLYGYRKGLKAEDTRAFNNYGAGEGVVVDWAGPRYSSLRSSPDSVTPSVASTANLASVTKAASKRKICDIARESYPTFLVNFYGDKVFGIDWGGFIDAASAGTQISNGMGSAFLYMHLLKRKASMGEMGWVTDKGWSSKQRKGRMIIPESLVKLSPQRSWGHLGAPEIIIIIVKEKSEISIWHPL
ncbi:hypothetical protein BU17DRAFT_65836 [Hysterangium stoloniferum]|nr:hypothetical protein BU17DRAFT_65836 [Hysterangium stoloniferum]